MNIFALGWLKDAQLIRSAQSGLGPRLRACSGTIPTAHENAIFLELTSFERYLDTIGCDIAQSSCLCYVIDALINGSSGRGEERLVTFATALLSRGVNADSTLNIDKFAEAPRVDDSCSSFRFDVFPRNSNLTCRQVVALAATERPLVAKLQNVMARY